MISDLTAKYFEAKIREGSNFDYLGWFRGVQDRKSHAQLLPTPIASGDAGDVEANNRENTSKQLDAPQPPSPARSTAITSVPRARCIADRNEAAENQLGRRLEQVCQTWRKFKTTRFRNAVYRYLGAVLELVERYDGRRRTRRLVQHAFKHAGLPIHSDADPFTALIRCTSDRTLDGKTISKWARALRYVAQCKEPRASLIKFMKKFRRDQWVR